MRCFQLLALAAVLGFTVGCSVGVSELPAVDEPVMEGDGPTAEELEHVSEADKAAMRKEGILKDGGPTEAPPEESTENK